jgi:hypothetical protein
MKCIHSTIFAVFLSSFLVMGEKLVTPDVVKKYEKKLLNRACDIQTGLSNAWASNLLAGCADSAAGFVSWFKGEAVTSFELKMFPMFMHFPNCSKLTQDFQSWVSGLSSDRIQEMDVLILNGKESNYDSVELFNKEVLHSHTIKRFFPSQTLTVEQLNDKLKEVSSTDYADEMFLRLTCDLLYREVVIASADTVPSQKKA